MSIFSKLMKVLASVIYVVFGLAGIWMFVNALEQSNPFNQFVVSIFFIVVGFGKLIDNWIGINRLIRRKSSPS